MEPDPIAENQTDVTIAALMARKDGDVVMSHGLAAALSYLKKLGGEVAEVKASLWTPDVLDQRIRRVHGTECDSCTVRKWVENYQRKLEEERDKKVMVTKPSLWSFLLSERGLLVIVVILFALMCARLTLGPQGYQDVTHTMRAGSGGQQK